MTMPGEKQGCGDYEEEASATGCGCFRLFCGGRKKSSQGESHYLLQGRQVYKETWLVTKFKKLKEFSELVAGPKWKNMIRKIGKVCNPKKKSQMTTQLQYSPGSYALNFDCGGEDEEEDNLLHSFSSRFASRDFSYQQSRDGL
ncbi:uncharacterized protein LOC111386821 [Olea europaea var. sylvestris]|uniref:uncharacterized protein LOC111386821 n=1 Tax=Olea europaea var. sylvestris TaxID=158386 RepID=UPI000C1CDF54|nr:uncharacterized protein LOC111386821 [Olea europaea var. sylvestris]